MSKRVVIGFSLAALVLMGAESVFCAEFEGGVEVQGAH